ncbi:MAG: hypothetical protein ACHQRJ_03020 [Alphaproteobacteria bacterium]
MTTYPAKCAKCNLPLQGPANPKPEDVFSWPGCGESDSLENVEKELAEYVAEKAADSLSAALKGAIGSSKHIKVTERHRSYKTHRFVIDYDPRT